MKYFFSSPSGLKKILEPGGARNFLLSYAVDAKHCKKFDDISDSVIIDSGAFTVWNRGEGDIDIEAYADFCLTLPQDWTFINVDVIPETGSTAADIERCCERGYENYKYLKSRIQNIMPVYHYGDNQKWLKKFMDEADYIGISPANDTHENVKRQFLKETYAICGTDVKTHALGYSSLVGLSMFPFYSVDSISYKRVKVLVDGSAKALLVAGDMRYLGIKSIQEYLYIEKYMTELWESRGVTWD